MGHYRMHIDIPFDPSDSEEECARKAQMVASWLENSVMIEDLAVEKVNYRLGHDDDRQKSNYLAKNENGHVSNKKISIVFSNGQRQSKRFFSDNP